MSFCSRRGFILGTTSIALTSIALTRAGVARADGIRLVKSERSELGTTLKLELPNAPFPAKGAPYTDSTVFVFVPAHLRASRDGATSLVVHFHGHNSTAEKALETHRLREQLADSKQDAILVVPQGPIMAADSSCGNLDTEGGFARLIDDVFAALRMRSVHAALGRTHPGTEPDRICLSAHSGGYHAAAACLKKGGIAVNEVYLFDALYADGETFRDWVIEGKGKTQKERHKLISYTTGGSTERNGEWLFAELERAGVVVAKERTEGQLSRAEITTAEAVSIRTAVTHGDVTNEWNSLRDCLYASALPRHLKTTWFDAKRGKRALDRRAQ
jgi:hypothetical protein